MCLKNKKKQKGVKEWKRN